MPESSAVKAFVTLTRQLHHLESNMKDLQLALTLQFESLQNKIAHVEKSSVSLLEGCEEIPDQKATAHALRRVEQRLENSEAAALNYQIITNSAMLGLQKRLDQMENAQEPLVPLVGSLGDLSAEAEAALIGKLADTGKANEAHRESNCLLLPNSYSSEEKLEEKVAPIVEKLFCAREQILPFHSHQLEVAVKDLQESMIECKAQSLKAQSVSERIAECECLILRAHANAEASHTVMDAEHADAEGAIFTTSAGAENKANINKMVTAADFTEPTQQTYTLNESVWDASFLMGMPRISLGTSAVLGVCLLFYLLLVLTFISIVADNEVLTKPTFDEYTQEEFHIFRTTVAHDVHLRNTLTDESLASAVCNKKLSLPFANLQVSIVKALEDYLGSGSNEEFSAGVMTPGALMCSVAVIVWHLTLASEVRSIADLMESFLDLPYDRHSSTQFETVDGYQERLISISRGRRFFIVVLMGLRFAVAVMLAWFGTAFLLYDIYIENMILNAVALDLILSLDELIFSAFLPRGQKALIRRIVPLQFRRTHNRWNAYGETFAMSFGLLVAFVCTFAFELSPFVGQLRDNLNALCGGVQGSLDFVMTADAIGIPWAAPTPRSSSLSATYAQAVAVQIQRMGFPEAALGPTERSNMGHFMQVLDADALRHWMDTFTGFKYPGEWATIDPSGMPAIIGWEEVYVLRDADYGDVPGTVYNHYLQYLLGMSGNASCAQVLPKECYKHGSTGEDVVMRKLCPGRCGCDSPTTGTVSSPKAKDAKVGFMGCSTINTRRKAFADELGELPCADTNSRAVFMSWLKGVGDAVNSSQGPLADNLNAAFSRGGCPEVVQVILVGSLSNMCTESSLPAICPESCGCKSSITWSPIHVVWFDFCPYSCGRPNSICRTVEVDHGDLWTGPTGPLVGFACVFPFVYKGQTYKSCTSVEWSGPWCAVTVGQEYGNSYYWGDCSPGC